MVMKVSLWAEIRRLHEVERLSKNAIARQLGCCHKTVRKALEMEDPPSQTARPARTSKLDGYKAQIDQLVGSTRKIIFDNLKAAVISGSGRYACLHPEFLELCGHFCLQPVACARRDPESKGMVETNVRYVKQNALAGRDDELTCWEDYGKLAEYWRDQVANVRIHETTRERPVDRFKMEQSLLRALPPSHFDTDEVVSAKVNSHARVRFDSNRYSVPPKLAQLYGREEVLAAIEQADQYETYDAEYVEAILHQQRRQRELPSPTEVLPVRSEWLDETDYESPDPAHYDRLIENDNDTPNESITEKT